MTGFRPEEVAISRAGGLLSPVTVVLFESELDRAAAAAGSNASDRFATVVGRLGGMPFLLGELTNVLWPSVELRPPRGVLGLSPAEKISGSLSSAGGVAMGDSSSAGSIAAGYAGRYQSYSCD